MLVHRMTLVSFRLVAVCATCDNFQAIGYPPPPRSPLRLIEAG